MRTWLVVVAVVVAAACTAAAVFAQTGTLEGHITDADTGDDLIGVDVVLTGNGKALQSDLDGRFAFAGLASGSYNLKIAYLGYAPQEVRLIQVNAGQATTVTIRLEAAEAFTTEDLVITADRIRTTETAVLAERKEAAVIGDAISAAQVQKSPDGTSGDALKRVTGLTVVDDQYVFIRGVTDRYNTTELNGVAVTGADTDSDRKSFNFDMVPASLLANTTVIKGATPDMPGDFAGGLVQVNTLEFPDQATTTVGVSMGILEGSTGKDLLVPAMSGGTDWLGLDDGTRDFPTDMPQATQDERNALAKALPNSWGTTSQSAPPKLSFNVAHGNHFHLFGDELGVVAAMSYRSEFDAGEFTERRSYPSTTSADGREYGSDILWGGLANLNWKFNENHRIGFNNNYNRGATQEVVEVGRGIDPSKYFERHSLQWKERYLELSQFAGKHVFPGCHGLELDWRAFYNKNAATEPDLRYIEYNIDDPEFPIMDENLRSWSSLNEIRRGTDIDVTVPILGEEGRQTKLKGGLSISGRRRDYAIEAWSAVPADLIWSPSWLPTDSIFAPELFGDPQGWDFIPFTAFSGEYRGGQDINAYYLMVDTPFAVARQDFRVAGGIRLENSSQFVNAVQDQDTGAKMNSRIDTDDWLPSVSLTYLPTANVNLRLGYFKSVNRPELREMAAVRYYDFHRFQNVIGNADLKRAVIDNLDLRVEYFPHEGEVLAASVFRKDLTDAVEEYLRPSPERNVLTWYNSPVGRNSGYELEARKDLGFLGQALSGVSIGGNYTRVWSEVEFQDVRYEALPDGTLAPVPFVNTRPMQGQSPWSLNASLSWDIARSGTALSLLYNKIGRRLKTVGDSRDTDVYEEPRDLIDLTVTQRLGENLRAKFGIKDLQGRDAITTSGSAEDVFSRHQGGTEYSLSLSSSF